MTRYPISSIMAISMLACSSPPETSMRDSLAFVRQQRHAANDSTKTALAALFPSVVMVDSTLALLRDQDVVYTLDLQRQLVAPQNLILLTAELQDVSADGGEARALFSVDLGMTELCLELKVPTALVEPLAALPRDRFGANVVLVSKLETISRTRFYKATPSTEIPPWPCEPSDDGVDQFIATGALETVRGLPK